MVEKVAFKGPVDPLGGGDLTPPFTGCNYILKRDVYLPTERGLLLHVKKNPLHQLTEIQSGQIKPN